MSLEALLSRLNRVRGRSGSYTACCPAHEDRSPSLSIREEGGKIVMHCFAGCDVASIVGAVGMDMTDLFPPRPDTVEAPARRVRMFASDLLKVVHLEAQIVMVAAFDMAKGKKLSAKDQERLKLAWQRIDSAMEAANG